MQSALFDEALEPLELELPHFDGATFDAELDALRLNRQLRVVLTYLRCAEGWHTLRELSRELQEPEASISARLRDLRKERFGGWCVEKRRRPGVDESRGVWEYRLALGRVCVECGEPISDTGDPQRDWEIKGRGWAHVECVPALASNEAAEPQREETTRGIDA